MALISCVPSCVPLSSHHLLYLVTCTSMLPQEPNSHHNDGVFQRTAAFPARCHSTRFTFSRTSKLAYSCIELTHPNHVIERNFHVIAESSLALRGIRENLFVFSLRCDLPANIALSRHNIGYPSLVIPFYPLMDTVDLSGIEIDARAET